MMDPATTKVVYRPSWQPRALAAGDLEAVVEIDAARGGRARRAYFERRLAAARREPEFHVQFGVERDGRLAGFTLGRVLEGEFGRAERALQLEVIGTHPAAQGIGLGAALGAALEGEAARRGIGELRTAALWHEHGMLRYLDRAGWSLAPNRVIDCALDDARLGASAESPVAVPQHERPSDQHDYGAPRADDFAVLARDTAEVRSLAAGDLGAIARIDRRLTGRDRDAYLRRKLDEALRDSAIRVSLVAYRDGAAAGYLMASADYGDFGRAEPVAVIDTIGVDPLRARQGIGRAMLSQLFLNLRALGIERIETVLAAANLDLLAFFSAAGFAPSERLAFVKRLG